MRFNGAAGAAALKSRNLSISKAARLIGEDRSHLSNILSGRRGAGAEMVRKFAELTGESPMVFIGPDDPREALLKACRVYKITAADLAEAS